MASRIQAVVAAEIAEAYMDQAEMRSSAVLCVNDAKSLIEQGKYAYAISRAIRSIEYSLGRFSIIWEFLRRFNEK